MLKLVNKNKKGAWIMSKKIFVTAMLCVGLMAIWGSGVAHAWPRITGWTLGCTDKNLDGEIDLLTECSLNCDAFIQGLGNPFNNDYAVDCYLNNIEMEVLCQTLGGGTGGEAGIPFGLTLGEESATHLINWEDFVSNGKAVASLYFSDCQFYDIVKDFDVCQNSNWSIIPPSGWSETWETDNPDCADVEGVTNGRFDVTATDVCIEVNDPDKDFYYVVGRCTLDKTDPTDIIYNCETLDSDKGVCADYTP